MEMEMDKDALHLYQIIFRAGAGVRNWSLIVDAANESDAVVDARRTLAHDIVRHSLPTGWDLAEVRRLR